VLEASSVAAIFGTTRQKNSAHVHGTHALEMKARRPELVAPAQSRQNHDAMRVHLTAVVAAASVGLLLVAACTTDYQKGVEDPNFGAPNALAGQKQPGPSSDTSTDGGGTGAAGTPECVKAGGALIDGGPCAVSFKTILAAFKAASCQTAGSCHGGATPPNQPRIDPDDATGMWAEFASFKLSNGKPYINPCSTDPAQSTIGCNVNATAPCGSVMPPGLGLAANVVADIDTWLKCGAPNN
jgi:hypothetical protein